MLCWKLLLTFIIASVKDSTVVGFMLIKLEFFCGSHKDRWRNRLVVPFIPNLGIMCVYITYFLATDAYEIFYNISGVLFYIFLEYCFTWVWNLVYFLKGRKWLEENAEETFEKKRVINVKEKQKYFSLLNSNVLPSHLFSDIPFLSYRRESYIHTKLKREIWVIFWWKTKRNSFKKLVEILLFEYCFHSF